MSSTSKAKLSCTAWLLKMKAPRSFQMSGTPHLETMSQPRGLTSLERPLCEPQMSHLFSLFTIHNCSYSPFMIWQKYLKLLHFLNCKLQCLKYMRNAQWKMRLQELHLTLQRWWGSNSNYWSGQSCSKFKLPYHAPTQHGAQRLLACEGLKTIHNTEVGAKGLDTNHTGVLISP